MNLFFPLRVIQERKTHRALKRKALNHDGCMFCFQDDLGIGHLSKYLEVGDMLLYNVDFMCTMIKDTQYTKIIVKSRNQFTKLLIYAEEHIDE